MTPAAPVRRALAWSAFCAWAAVVWLVSSRSRPGTDLGVDWEVPDKAAHAVEFAVGGYLARAAVATIRGAASAPALVACAAWGFVDEVHQGFVPGRETDPWDLAADVAGAAMGVGVHAWTRRRRPPLVRASR